MKTPDKVLALMAGFVIFASLLTFVVMFFPVSWFGFQAYGKEGIYLGEVMEYARDHVHEKVADEELVQYHIDRVEFLDYLEQDISLPEKLTPLFRSAAIQHMDDFSFYLKRVGDLKLDGNSLALYFPAILGSKKMAELFSQSGLWNGLQLKAGRGGETPTQVAVRLGHVRVAEILMEIENRKAVEGI